MGGMLCCMSFLFIMNWVLAIALKTFVSYDIKIG